MKQLLKTMMVLYSAIVLMACSSTMPEPTPTATSLHTATPFPNPPIVSRLTATLTPTTTSGSTFTPVPTSTSIPRPTDTPGLSPTHTKTQEPTMTTSAFGLCPVDMSMKDTRITTAYDEYGYNYDLWAPHGTPIKSPGECSVISLYIDSRGTQGLHISCSDYPLRLARRISFGHIDLAWNDYETIRMYGIPVDTFFDTSGKPKLGVENVPPVKNMRFHRGNAPVAYVGNTGDHPMPYHVHITVWSTNNNSDKLDPAKFFSCGP